MINFEDIEEWQLLVHLSEPTAIDKVDLLNKKATRILYNRYCKKKHKVINSRIGKDPKTYKIDEPLAVRLFSGNEIIGDVVVLAHTDKMLIGDNWLVLGNGDSYFIVKNIHKDNMELLLKRIKPYIVKEVDNLVSLQVNEFQVE